ncbi:acetolactate synthase small subunit [Ammoniphilus sp. YIM 78166]|uniref:acetolactate synthase small subunit n=1 Tax=Ammoniphilus sp. YIM 78166 TaxID=1644106 RepID=UPI00142FF0DD|nr:acetolactate synthase small subunit [Ammoniphilus sp. YIM 78166]
MDEMQVKVLFYNRPSVLVRLVGLLSKPGLNIDNMVVKPSEQQDLSNMLIMVEGNQEELQLIFKQIEKLDDVIKIDRVD